MSFHRPDQVAIAIDVCQSFALDNGAFSAWRAGDPVIDWRSYYAWAGDLMRVPGCDFAVIPDAIDGNEADNDALVSEWPLPTWFGAPVWHMHESLERLERLSHAWPRVCLGSSGDFAVVGNDLWWGRMGEAMRVLCDEHGRPRCRLHGLRMLNPKVFSRLPFASADSTNIARNVGIDSRWKGTYAPPTKESRAQVMRERIEAHNAPAVWMPQPAPAINDETELLW